MIASRGQPWLYHDRPALWKAGDVSYPNCGDYALMGAIPRVAQSAKDPGVRPPQMPKDGVCQQGSVRTPSVMAGPLTGDGA
ncbi:hypothetical protein NDU88_006365 [Pleurodeles waltl]|uniref:Uncharacterized protein n=1 Tax=Pleurodeles waltl TaxID=8319 RepID=A0AAV7RL82_PLEWA|nr:hypothetical protein NDU88_006365 [Pleurodeles waltl]